MQNQQEKRGKELRQTDNKLIKQAVRQAKTD
jgi:hypothetical protein